MNRITLTDEDKTIVVDQFAGVIPNGDYFVKIYCKEMVIGVQLKKQILDDYEFSEKFQHLMDKNLLKEEFETISITNNQFKELKEKAEKWDKYNKSYWALKEKYPKLRDSYSKLEQENKQLKEYKEELTAVCKHDSKLLKEMNELNDNLNEIVQKVREFISHYIPEHGGGWATDINEILKE